MPAVIGISVDMDDDQSGDREARDRLDEVATTFLATPVPVKFGFTDAQTFHGPAHFCNVVVFAQYGREEVGAGVQVGARSALVGPGC
jgi:hypothetical protein